jgi:hypothetical protein
MAAISRAKFDLTSLDSSDSVLDEDDSIVDEEDHPGDPGDPGDHPGDKTSKVVVLPPGINIQVRNLPLFEYFFLFTLLAFFFFVYIFIHI